MNLFSDFQSRILHIVEGFVATKRLPMGLDLTRFGVEPPRDASHGDLSCNVAMVLARDIKAFFVNPRQFATEIAFELAKMPDVAEAEVAGPGFINIRLKPTAFAEILRTCLRQGAQFGAGQTKAMKVNVEYVSANPTGPMHVGHGRGAVFGDALARLIEFSGAKVVREYYINDAGAQVDVLAKSAYLRYREALGETTTIPEGLYPGAYLIPVGEALARQYGKALLDKPETEWLAPIRASTIDAMMAMIRADLAALNISHAVFFSERSLFDNKDGPSDIERALATLQTKGLIYQGRLPPPKGQLPEDWEDREQTLFKSTAYGDDVDRPLKKSDGTFTYFASDIAYHQKKIEAGFDVLVDVWGADHGGYVKRMTAAVSALSDKKVPLDVKLCQMVKLVRAGAPVKMSKRSGDFVTLREVVDEVGLDAVRFMMLFRKNDAPLDFDLTKVIEQSRENPVFYVQYAHARARSVFRQAIKAFEDIDLSPHALATADLSLLVDEGEANLMRVVAQYPRLIEQAAAAHEPHRVAFFLHDLASAFHSHWSRGKDLPQLRFVNEENRQLSKARLALVGSISQVLAAGLDLLGVSAPEEMR